MGGTWGFLRVKWQRTAPLGGRWRRFGPLREGAHGRKAREFVEAGLAGGGLPIRRFVSRALPKRLSFSSHCWVMCRGSYTRLIAARAPTEKCLPVNHRKLGLRRPQLCPMRMCLALAGRGATIAACSARARGVMLYKAFVLCKKKHRAIYWMPGQQSRWPGPG